METRKCKRRLLLAVILGLLSACMLFLPAFADGGNETSREKTAQTEEKTVTGTVLNVNKIPTAGPGRLKKVGKNYQYIYKDGSKAVGWKQIKGKVYYFSPKGNAVTGLNKIGTRQYYFDDNGVRQTGWIKVDRQKQYFLKTKNGARARGLTKIRNYYYYFKNNGKMLTGWLKKSGNYYFFDSKGHRVTGWLQLNGNRYYLDPAADGARATGKVMIDGSEYQFSADGILATPSVYPDSEDSFYVDSTGNRLKKSTIKKLLLTALQPVGSTMYVWGGGWTVSGGADIVARTIGVSPRWREFFEKQTSSYDYNTTRWQTKDGLDCSGYVGWVIYNTFNVTSGHAGYVMGAEIQARTFAEYGWGAYTPYYNVADHRPGDIMSLAEGHVYIVIGECSDGSVVLVHSSPKGVMITGTTTRSGSKNSEAIKLSNRYMQKYYPAWYAKYPENWRGTQYLTGYSRMRWYLTGSRNMLTDPDGYAGMNAQQVLKDLFCE